MAEIDGVREYDRIRRFLGRIYLYGFFSREDFAKQGGVGSKKDYDYGAKLIRAIFPDSEEAALWHEGKKYLRIQRVYAKSGESRLADSYMLHTLDVAEELPELLYLLGALAAGKETMGGLCSLVELHTADEDTFRYSTVRRRVLELVEYGYAEKQRGGFTLAEDGLASLTDRELRQLLDFVGFAEGVAYPRAAGSFLRRTVRRELLRRGLALPGGSPLLLRHSVNANVFDEELVYQLLELMAQGRTAQLGLPSRPGSEKKTYTVESWPVALRADARLGRWYLMSVENGRPMLRRLKNIQSVKPGAPLPEDYPAERERTRAVFSKSAFSSAVPAGEPVLVRARLRFEGAEGMLEQFRRELRLGEVIEEPEGLVYQAWVNDPRELRPLLRMYAPWLRVLPGDHHLDEQVRQDLEEMRRSLGEDDHETAE